MIFWFSFLFLPLEQLTAISTSQKLAAISNHSVKEVPHETIQHDRDIRRRAVRAVHTGAGG